MPEMSGSCGCGQVTYQTSADPVFTGVCHCKACQKSTGTAFAVVVAVPTVALTISGTTKSFGSMGDSGKATHRNFCPACGTTVTQTADILDGLTMLMLGTLDNAASIKPGMQIYCDSALPWAMVADIPGVPKMPSPNGG